MKDKNRRDWRIHNSISDLIGRVPLSPEEMAYLRKFNNLSDKDMKTPEHDDLKKFGGHPFGIRLPERKW